MLVNLWWSAMLIKREYVRLRNVCVCVWVCKCVCLSTWVSVCVCLCEWVSVFVMMSDVDKAWICSAEEFLELYGKVEAVVGNCLLRWSGHLFEVRKVEAVVRNYLLRCSGHLFEVPNTHLFDQCFCFRHITPFLLRQEYFSADIIIAKILYQSDHWSLKPILEWTLKNASANHRFYIHISYDL